MNKRAPSGAFFVYKLVSCDLVNTKIYNLAGTVLWMFQTVTKSELCLLLAHTSDEPVATELMSILGYLCKRL